MTLSTGSVKFPYLSSSRFHAVDCKFTHDRLEAGWVFIDGHLNSVEVVRGDGIEAAIAIPEDVQRITNPTTFSFPEEPVEWILHSAPRLT